MISRILGKTVLVLTLGFVAGSVVTVGLGGITNGVTLVGAGTKRSVAVIGVKIACCCGAMWSSSISAGRVVVANGVMSDLGGCTKSSSSISAGCGFVGMLVALLMLGDGDLTFFCFVGSALMWPLTVAWERGGNLLSCATVTAGKLRRKSDSIAFAIVVSVGENNAAWRNVMRSAMVGLSMTALIEMIFFGGLVSC